MFRAERPYLESVLTLTAQCIGEDWCLQCYGGSRPHVGAVSIAQPYVADSGKFTASFSCASAYGHKDAELGNLIAMRVAKRTGKTAAVVCGIHYEGLSPEKIKEIIEIYMELCEEALQGVIE